MTDPNSSRKRAWRILRLRGIYQTVQELNFLSEDQHEIERLIDKQLLREKAEPETIRRLKERAKHA